MKLNYRMDIIEDMEEGGFVVSYLELPEALLVVKQSSRRFSCVHRPYESRHVFFCYRTVDCP